MQIFYRSGLIQIVLFSTTADHQTFVTLGLQLHTSVERLLWLNAKTFIVACHRLVQQRLGIIDTNFDTARRLILSDRSCCVFLQIGRSVAQTHLSWLDWDFIYDLVDVPENVYVRRRNIHD